MNEQLKKYLLSLGCSVINPVWKSLTDRTEVGYHCKSSSGLRKDQHMEKINRFIEENKLEYYLSDKDEATVNFFIYINKETK